MDRNISHLLNNEVRIKMTRITQRIIILTIAGIMLPGFAHVPNSHAGQQTVIYDTTWTDKDYSEIRFIKKVYSGVGEVYVAEITEHTYLVNRYIPPYTSNIVISQKITYTVSPYEPENPSVSAEAFLIENGLFSKKLWSLDSLSGKGELYTMPRSNQQYYRISGKTTTLYDLKTGKPVSK